MNSDYNALVDIIIEPKIILYSLSTSIIYGKINEFNFIVSIITTESVIGSKLLLKLNSQNVIALDFDSFIINKVIFPGVTNIEMILEKTGCNAIKTINIDFPKSKLEPVLSSIEKQNFFNSRRIYKIFS